MKPNCNIFIEEYLTIIKKVHDKCVTLMNRDSEIYVAWHHKRTFYRFYLITDDPVNV